MAKLNKEKHPKTGASSSFEMRSNTLKKYSLVAMLVISIVMVAFGTYLYMTTSYQHYQAIKDQQSASTDELMRKMKQMLDDEKARLASQEVKAEPNVTQEQNHSMMPPVAPTPTPVVVADNNMTTQTPHVETNETAVLNAKEEDSKKNELSEVKEYQYNLKNEKPSKPSVVVRKVYPPGTTPKLAIVIDDVSFAWQTHSIKEIPYKVSPSFFPPTKGHPDTVKLSHDFEFAMIHLPMESRGYSSPEEDTLNTTDGIDVIEKRISRIKAWFPQIKYYNNHTGGTYTADFNAMDRLIKVLKEHDLLFVDSRTIGATKVPAACKKYDMFCFSRDVFLDNSLDKTAIRTQLKEAVAKAKKNGYAIAIGHPHKNTLEVLKNASDLFEGIELVYLKDL